MMPALTIPNYFQNHQKKILCSITFLILIIPLFLNFWHGKPLMMGQESYYHLENAKELHPQTFYYYPLSLLLSVLPETVLAFLPVFLGVSAILLLLILLNKNAFSSSFTVSFVVMTFLSPVFIYSFSTFSASGFFLFLFVLGVYLLQNETKKIRYLSIIPFLYATYIDVTSTLFLIIFLAWHAHRKKDSFSAVLLTVVIASMFLNVAILHQQLTLGPFFLQDATHIILSDFGAKLGMGSFVFLLSLVGIFTFWDSKEKYIGYIILVLTALLYGFNHQAALPFIVVMTFFAAAGLHYLFGRNWTLKKIHKFTLFFLFLGILFSTLTYLDRMQIEGPFPQEREVLSWIKENTAANTKVFSHPDNSYFISYFAERQPLYWPHLAQPLLENESNTILTALYIEDLFPVLERNNIGMIYITPSLKKNLPSDRGLLFLLHNERFKLVYSEEGYEVWAFTRR